MRTRLLCLRSKGGTLKTIILGTLGEITVNTGKMLSELLRLRREPDETISEFGAGDISRGRCLTASCGCVPYLFRRLCGTPQKSS
eukprot:1826-Pyramimonas_sp.AAC.1